MRTLCRTTMSFAVKAYGIRYLSTSCTASATLSDTLLGWVVLLMWACIRGVFEFFMQGSQVISSNLSDFLARVCD